MRKTILMFTMGGILLSCSNSDDSPETINIGISASANANAGTSYTRSNQVDIFVGYYTAVPIVEDAGDLRDAITYLDANGDGLTDIFMATGDYLSSDEVDCILELNDGMGSFYRSTEEFNGNIPKATHARKSIVGDFNSDGLDDIFVFDHGYDAGSFPGSNPKLIIQDGEGSFSWNKLTDQTGFHHGGASADIDNDGDLDIFVGGFDPFFYINDGNANFQMVTDRFDGSIAKIFIAELIDVDEDGYVDLLVGAHEHDGEDTTIYWGSSSGSYSDELMTIVPAWDGYGVVLDIDAEDLDGDGDRDLVLNRTGSNNFYVGVRIQLLFNDGGRNFIDGSSRIDDYGTDSDGWFPWVRAQDYDNDGDVDIFSDDKDDNFILLNDGDGNFNRQY